MDGAASESREAAVRRVQGPGTRVQGSGCRVQGSGSRVQGSGFTMPALSAKRERYSKGVEAFDDLRGCRPLCRLLRETERQGEREREREREIEREREGERQRTGYEPSELHAPIQRAMQGGVIKRRGRWIACSLRGRRNLY